MALVRVRCISHGDIISRNLAILIISSFRLVVLAFRYEQMFYG